MSHARARAGVAVDHDVDLVADRLSHRRDAPLGMAHRGKALERHRRRHRHRLERGEALLHHPRCELAETLRLVALVEVLHLPAAQMAVEPDVVPHRPAPELVAGDAVHLAEDVPEGDVDAAHRGAADDPVAVPEVLAEHHLPEVLDARRVLADDQVGQVLDRPHDRSGVPFERRLAPAVEAGLVGEHPDEDPVPHPRVADVRLDRGDLHETPSMVRRRSPARFDQAVDLAAVDVRRRDPVGPAVRVLIEDLVERHALDEIEILARRQVARVVVAVPERERRFEGAQLADPRAAFVEELERVRDDHRIADRDDLQLGTDRLVGPPHHVGVHRARRTLVVLRELLSGRGGVHALGPHLRERARRERVDLRDARLELLESVRDPAAPEVEHLGARRDRRAGGRGDRRNRLQHRGGDRLTELVATLVRVAARLAVSEPVVPGSDVAAAGLHEQALGSGQPALDGDAQRPGELGVPLEDLAAHQRRMAGEARHDGDRRAVVAVDEEDGHAVVHGPLATHAVDGDAGRRADARADAGRPAMAPGRVDGACEQVGKSVRVAFERGHVREAADRRAPRDARCAVVVRRVDEHGLRSDARSARCTSLRVSAVSSAPANTRSSATIATALRPSSRTSAWAIIGSWMPSARPGAQRPAPRG